VQVDQQTHYIGEIMVFAGRYAIQGWLPCEGQTLAVKDYVTLFAVIGNLYGGDRGTTFRLPDLRGVLPLGANPHAAIGARSTTETSFGGTIEQAVEAHNLPPLPAQFKGAELTVSGKLGIRATQSSGQGLPQEDYVLGYGGASGAGQAAIYVPPGALVNPVTLAGGTLKLSGTPSGKVAVNPDGEARLPIRVPTLSLSFYIAIEGIFPH
jgi:microcystin-dependent protein